MTSKPAVGFQVGINGAHGAAGDPGLEGGFGSSGIEIDNFITQSGCILGFRGGNGENGGAGVDGEDSDQTAFGGRSGRRAQGGGVTTTIIIEPELNDLSYLGVTGGTGGTAGMFGRGTKRALDGWGATAGYGGGAVIFPATASRDMRLVVTGSNG